ncbi:meiosis-specific with OB domain-containing [Brachionus plicatilis]|uniref:Meiosis-specific with OB domain-containing n=1 Tax=Brachionus plicatilis TaxID=10195 RepID=A0A3M7PTM6_BRAPC|nr:meiosis-specific with OB domain-containing [Brachionus plicatilis]
MNIFRAIPRYFTNRICEIQPEIEITELTGLVLLKQEKRVVTSPKIKIKNPIVKIKNLESDDELYRPWTPSNYCLVLNEPIGSIEPVDESTRPDLLGLKSVPVRDHNDFYTLEDLELIKFASTWLVKKTVIFGIDLRLYYNEYTKSLEASTTSKTIFTSNPDIREGYSLHIFAKNCHLEEPLPLIDQIRDKAIKTNIESLKKSLSQAFLSEYVLLDAVITSFDIDSDSSLFSFKCKRCNLDVQAISKKCPNQNCKDQDFGYIKLVNRKLTLSDHTSSLSGVGVSGKIFESMIGMTIEEFMKLDEEAKTKVKWFFLFERKRLLIKVTCQSSESDDEAFLKYYFKLINIEELENN